MTIISAKVSLEEGQAMRRTIPADTLSEHAAKILHEQGRSCSGLPMFTYDANGNGRWCADCGAALGEVPWVEDGSDVPGWWIGLAIAILGAILLLVVSSVAFRGPGTTREPSGGISGGPVATPAPYGPPDARSGGPVQHNKMEVRWETR